MRDQSFHTAHIDFNRVHADIRAGPDSGTARESENKRWSAPESRANENINCHEVKRKICPHLAVQTQIWSNDRPQIAWTTKHMVAKDRSFLIANSTDTFCNIPTKWNGMGSLHHLQPCLTVTILFNAPRSRKKSFDTHISTKFSTRNVTDNVYQQPPSNNFCVALIVKFNQHKKDEAMALEDTPKKFEEPFEGCTSNFARKQIQSKLVLQPFLQTQHLDLLYHPGTRFKNPTLSVQNIAVVSAFDIHFKKKMKNGNRRWVSQPGWTSSPPSFEWDS